MVWEVFLIPRGFKFGDGKKSQYGLKFKRFAGLFSGFICAGLKKGLKKPYVWF